MKQQAEARGGELKSHRALYVSTITQKEIVFARAQTACVLAAAMHHPRTGFATKTQVKFRRFPLFLVPLVLLLCVEQPLLS